LPGMVGTEGGPGNRVGKGLTIKQNSWWEKRNPHTEKLSFNDMKPLVPGRMKSSVGQIH